MSSFSNLGDDDFWRRIDRLLTPIPHEGNRALLKRYIRERLANGIRASTLASDANAIRGLLLQLGIRPVESLTRDDVMEYVTHAFTQRRWANRKKDGSETITHGKRQRLGPATLANRKVTIRDFVRWMRGTGDEYPPEVSGLKTTRSNEDTIPTDELITRDDLLAMIQAHPTPREKAILAVLHESGMRASEFCSLNIRSVTFDEYGAVLTLPKKTRGERTKGLKTGARRVRLFDSVPYLQAWFEAHPNKNDPEAPLWLSDSRRAGAIRLSANALWTFTAKAGERAKLRKHIHPHLFRHSAATERARSGWNEAAMRAFFGWSRNSDMPSRYVHLAGLDYEDMELKRRGFKGDETRGKPALAPVKCRGCHAANVPTNSFCEKCRAPLTPKSEDEISKRREEEINEAVAREVRRLLGDREGERGSA
jgi:site-specific recombinase XerC